MCEDIWELGSLSALAVKPENQTARASAYWKARRDAARQTAVGPDENPATAYGCRPPILLCTQHSDTGVPESSYNQEA